MNVLSILSHAHARIHEVVDPLGEQAWDLPNVCGVWSTKQIVAHLTGWAGCFEELVAPHAGVVVSTTDIEDARQLGEDGFNAKYGTVAAHQTVEQICAAYDEVWARVLDLAARVPAERWREAGTLTEF